MILHYAHWAASRRHPVAAPLLVAPPTNSIISCSLVRLRILDAVRGPEPETPSIGGTSGRMRCDQSLLIIEHGSNHREN